MADLLDSQAGPAVPAAPTRILDRRLRATTVGLVSIVTFIAFEAMAVATALPTAVRELDGLAYYGWSFTAFLVTNVVGMVAGGELSDRYGAARPMVLGLVVFTAGLVVAGFAPVMGVFVLGRAVQGLGSGVVSTTIYVVIGAAYAESLRPRVFAAVSAAWVVPALVGPIVAGLLAQHVSWRAVFLGLPPFIVVGTALLMPSLRRLPAGARRQRAAAGAPSWRWAAALAAAAGISAVQWAGQRPSWLGAAAAVCGFALLGLGLRRLLPPGTVALRPGVPAVVALRGLLAGSFFAVESLVPLILTVVHGFSPTAAGVPLMVGAVGWSAASWWQGRRPDVPRHRLVRAGFLLIVAAALGMATVSQAGVPAWLAYAYWVLAGLGAGLGMPSVGLLLLSLTPPAERGVNSASLQISDVVASALCIGLGGVLVAAAERGALSLSSAALLVDLLMAGLALTAAALAGRARDPG